VRRASEAASVTNNPVTVNVSVLVMDSRALAMSTDLGANVAAGVLDRLADYEFGQPLDYRDPTGDTATWNALVDHVHRERARISQHVDHRAIVGRPSEAVSLNG